MAGAIDVTTVVKSFLVIILAIVIVEHWLERLDSRKVSDDTAGRLWPMLELLKRAEAEQRTRSFQSVHGFHLDVSSPNCFHEHILDLVLPDVCRGCLLGDLLERYQTEIVPSYVLKLGASAGMTAAQEWYRYQVRQACYMFLIHRVKSLGRKGNHQMMN